MIEIIYPQIIYLFILLYIILIPLQYISFQAFLFKMNMENDFKLGSNIFIFTGYMVSCMIELELAKERSGKDE